MFILLKSKFHHINMAYLIYPFPYRWTFRKFQSFTITDIRIMITLDSGAHMQQCSMLMHKHGLAGPQDVSTFHFPKYFQMFPKLGWQFTVLSLSLSSMWECHFPQWTTQAACAIRQERNRLSPRAVLTCTSWPAKCVCWLAERFLCELTAHVVRPCSFIHWVLCLFSWIYRHSWCILDSNCLSELLKYLLQCHMSFNICLWFLLFCY